MPWYSNEEGRTAPEHSDMEICDQIREERRLGKTRCGIIKRRMSLAEAARAFGLADDSAIYKTVGRAEADAVATHILQADLAHGSKIMSASRAADLWSQFMTRFGEQDVRFATNAGVQVNSWTPATSSTFDKGILVIGDTAVGCLWAEDED